MRFKLLHVMPYVWIHKHKESVGKSSSSSSPNADDNGDHVPVFKRSTSLKLVKSSSSPAPDSNKSTKVTKSGKQVQVCTVVDAGCTCRATMTSQHKQKKNQGVSSENKDGASSVKGPKTVLSSSCKPRTVEGSDSFVQTIEPDLQWRLRNADSEEKKSKRKKKSPYSSASVMSSSLSSSLNTNTVSTATSEADELVLDARSSNNIESPNGITDMLRSKPRNSDLFDKGDGDRMAPLPSLQELMEEYVASKANVKHVDMESLYHHSNGRASFAGFHCNQQLELEDCFNKVKSTSRKARRSTTSVMVDNHCRSSSREEIGFSDAVELDRRIMKVSVVQRDNAVKVRKEEISDAMELERRRLHDVSDASELDRRVMKMYQGNVAKPHWTQEALDATSELEGRHDVIEFDSRPRKMLLHHNSLAKDSLARHWQSNKEDNSDTIELERRVMKISVQCNDDAEVVESSSCESDSEAQVEVVLSTVVRGNGGANADDEGGSQIPPFTSSYSSSSSSTSYSCEINVPKDYGYYNGKEDDRDDDGNADDNDIDDCRNGCISPSTSTAMSITSGHDGEMGRKYSGAVAMVKSSFDPHHDFKKSMAEMVVAKRLRDHGQLQQLLQCYLSLNPHQYHATIVEAFHELCSDLLPH